MTTLNAWDRGTRFREKIEKGFQNEAFTEQRFLGWLQRNGRVKFNADCENIKKRYFPEHSAADRLLKTAGSYTPRNAQERIQYVEGEWEKSVYHEEEAISGVDKTFYNASDNKLIGIMTETAQIVKSRFMQGFSDELFDGDGTTQANSSEGLRFTGITAAMPISAFPGSHTYAGIPYAGNTWWQHTVVDATAGSNTWANNHYETMLAAISGARVVEDGKVMQANIGFANLSVINTLKKYAYAKNTPNVTGSTSDAHFGNNGVQVDGISIFPDENIPSGRMFFCHPSAFELLVATPNLVKADWYTDQTRVGNPMVFTLEHYGCFRVVRPRLCAWVHTIS